MRPVFVIPARGGSKRIPRKNIRSFHGVPMIQRAIELVIAADIEAEVVVSTDDEEIASLALAAGALPLPRPVALADDHAGTTPVVAHAVEEMELSDEVPVCCLYATVPLLQAERLRQGFERLQAETTIEFVFAAQQFDTAPQRALRRDADGEISPFLPEFAEQRTQDMEPLYHDAGQFYWARAATWRAQRHPFRSRSLMVVLDRSEVCDIDTEDDWAIAEALYSARQKSGS